MHVRLVERFAVDVDLLVLLLQPLPWQSDDALDQVALGLDRRLEHDDVTASNCADRHQRALQTRRSRREHELVHEQMIADEQVVLHRAGRNLERLQDERPDEEREDYRDEDRFEILANRRLLEIFRHGRRRYSSDSVTIRSTTRNA